MDTLRTRASARTIAERADVLCLFIPYDDNRRPLATFLQ